MRQGVGVGVGLVGMGGKGGLEPEEKGAGGAVPPTALRARARVLSAQRDARALSLCARETTPTTHPAPPSRAWRPPPRPPAGGLSAGRGPWFRVGGGGGRRAFGGFKKRRTTPSFVSARLCCWLERVMCQGGSIQGARSLGRHRAFVWVLSESERRERSGREKKTERGRRERREGGGDSSALSRAPTSPFAHTKQTCRASYRTNHCLYSRDPHRTIRSRIDPLCNTDGRTGTHLTPPSLPPSRLLGGCSRQGCLRRPPRWPSSSNSSSSAGARVRRTSSSISSSRRRAGGSAAPLLLLLLMVVAARRPCAPRPPRPRAPTPTGTCASPSTRDSATTSSW
jgi:hypothetical protein